VVESFKFPSNEEAEVGFLRSHSLAELLVLDKGELITLSGTVSDET